MTSSRYTEDELIKAWPTLTEEDQRDLSFKVMLVKAVVERNRKLKDEVNGLRCLFLVECIGQIIPYAIILFLLWQITFNS